MRKEISQVYQGTGWSSKVKVMNDSQVIAIYHSFLQNNRFQKKQKSYVKEHKQLTFDDFIFD